MQFGQINSGDTLAEKVASLVTNYCEFLRNIVQRTRCKLFSQFCLLTTVLTLLLIIFEPVLGVMDTYYSDRGDEFTADL